MPTPGNGPDNRVDIQVVAINSVGASDPAGIGEAVWSDIVPAAPAALDTRPLDHGLRVFWRKPTETGGSPITYYAVSVAGVTGTKYVSADDAVGTSYSIDITDAAIGNGAAVEVEVSGRNDAYGRSPNWNTASGSGTPAGAPVVAGTPTAGIGDADGSGEGTVTLDWSGSFDGNGAGIGEYFAAMYQGTPPTCSAQDDGGRGTDLSVPAASQEFRHMGTATSTTFTVPANQQYTFMVFAYNGQGCTSSGELRAVSRKTPGTPTAVGIGGPDATGDGRYDYRLDSVDYTSGGGNPDVTYGYRISGDASSTWTVRKGGALLADGSLYGRAVAIEVQACEAFPEKTLCSDWSAPSATFTPVDTRPGGLSFSGTVAGGTWSWTGSPSGSGYSSVQYTCDGGATWASMPTSGSCAAGVDASFSVRVTTPSGAYASPTYRWYDFD
ncbi:hypothetical protein [Naasia aerilata]|uniref:Fibronectin type III domain-containing protein n=1 Tax=Naasia aerilata TaxID=1162966 RepID=A0ABN6XH08_9MICO|nr:hypothetical protein [Naasia aerilata]BDZ44182.1 hypothetical protein GCM10025866_00910 [Naasia aerilata]